jgi:hypothetical protein
MALSPHYFVDEAGRPAHPGYAAVRVPMLVYSAADDALATETQVALQRPLAAFVCLILSGADPDVP